MSVAPGGHLTGAVGTNIKITHSAATNVAANSNYFKQTSLAPIREESGSVSVGSLTATQGHSINNAPGVQLQAPLPSQQQDMQVPAQTQQQNLRQQQQLQKQPQQQRRDKAFV